jgi:hypothetical protein
MTANPTNLPMIDRVLVALERPLSKIGVEALAAFFALPNIDQWCPENLYLSQLSRVFDIGLPFALLTGNKTADAHRLAVAGQLAEEGFLSNSVISEVHAAALLSHWGGRVEFVPRAVHRTPDLSTVWTDGKYAEVEVARAETKHLHQAVKKGIEVFVGALRPGDVQGHIFALIEDASNSSDLTAMFDAATNLLPGAFAEEIGKWFVRVIPLDQRDEVVGERPVDIFGPNWWPRNKPEYFANHCQIGPEHSPVITLRSKIPVAQYTNPILRKATSAQRQQGRPFLIAVDVSKLPEAHELIAAQIDDYLKIWDHVSGILLFEPRFWIGVGRKEWVVSVHVNSSASLQLPAPLAALSEKGKFTVSFSIS